MINLAIVLYVKKISLVIQINNLTYATKTYNRVMKWLKAG